MNISDEELRAMVRAAVAAARHEAPPNTAALSASDHASHGRLTLTAAGDPDGQCVIEPAVRCTHCGYCQSLGH